MSVFEGRAWIANKGLLDVSIEVENGHISSVKKTNSNPDKEKVNGLILPAQLHPDWEEKIKPLYERLELQNKCEEKSRGLDVYGP